MMKGASLPINTVSALALSIIGAVFFLAVVLPLLMSQQGQGMCVGPYKMFASMIADMSGANICQ
mgnify:CR=1 FL=1